MAEISSVAVIGLGAMGSGAAHCLIEAGYTVYGTDLRQEMLARFSDDHGQPCPTAADAAKSAGAVIEFVVNDEQAEEVLFGDQGALKTAKPGTLFIICSTMAASAVSRFSTRLEEAGMRVVDAPVTGGANRAMRGELTIMISGDPENVELATPILDCISGRIQVLGNKVGQASQIKLINQQLSGIHIAATAEAMTLAKSIGVDLNKMYQIISRSTGSSWIFEDRGQQIISEDYKIRSSINIVLKDLEIITSEASEHDIELPLSEAARRLFSSAAEAGMGTEDGSAITRFLSKENESE